MMERMKKVFALLLCLGLLSGCICDAAAGDDDPLSKFMIHHGSRDSKKIAITVDDCYKTATEWIEADVELCKQYGIAMTFFPLVYTGCLEEKYRDMWQSALDCGCELGTHTYSHLKISNRDVWGIIGALAHAQEATDKTLGYHYEIRWLRVPGGSIGDGKKLTEQQAINAIKKYGFDHIVHWDVSETKNLEKALNDVQNGSILLFHAKKKDTHFLEKLIPELKDRGFEMVTLSEMFCFPPPETSDELYVYDKEQFRKKE